MRVFESEALNCNLTTTKVFVDNQNHGGIVELDITIQDFMDEDKELHIEAELDSSQIDALINALQEAKKFALEEARKEYGDSYHH